ncbi:Deoxyribodipyrimidine photo-lyase type II [Friedmanniella luteola]|uniref:Deoxyribodipyrimidine photo-lyase n=1 Tax=Friedmanniella luteola TaxID=546871 RepID=A0A1H1TTQ5_9ACTN|nr:deoxyribodipyrimidine photo-lyase [Friedmanniella luteola]SDS63580.1 Deoxyribodipyrimidine photo-lyase type II [Friedmanniella luteola]
MATSTKRLPDPPADVYPGIQAERVQLLNDDAVRDDGRHVLYWMQQAQRAELNHALEYAVRRANDLGLPLLVAFGLMDGYPEANLRHYHFMVHGLADVADALRRRHVPFVVQRGAPDEVALRLAADAALVVCDRGYLRPQRAWRERVAAEAGCSVVQVESDVVVPVELASDKKETAARTLRPKITRHLERFLVALPQARLVDTTVPDVEGEDLDDPDALLDRLALDRSVAPVLLFEGGTSAGERVLADFLASRFAEYAAHRNQPQTDHVSHMSKYLHFGQLSPVYIALQVREHADRVDENVETYLEELIVRRELPMNFVYYEPRYDSYEQLPGWARQTLAEHARDRRDPQYTAQQLEDGQTDDPYWNAAMDEMRYAGYLHNYMRMYWGKKILEWSATPEEAYATTLRLNNTYFVDGRDANSYANVAWVFGQHDRGWTERTVFGKTRYMNAAGLERKADPQAFVEKVARTVAAAQQAGSRS